MEEPRAGLEGLCYVDGCELALYRGLLWAHENGEWHLSRGTVALETESALRLAVRLSTRVPKNSQVTRMAVPEGVPMNPPTSDTEPLADVGWEPLVNEIQSGSMDSAVSVSVLIFGTKRGGLDGRDALDGLEVGDWVLQARDTPADVASTTGFEVAVEARPRGEHTPTAESVNALRAHLFLLLSFVVGREVGVGPVVAHDRDGRVVCVHWGAPLFRSGDPGTTWCPPLSANDAVTQLSCGLSEAAKDPVMRAVTTRAIRMLLSADATDLLEIRITTACVALETLAWAVLQRQGLAIAEGLGRMSAADMVRLLLRWAQVPVETPDHFGELDRRRKDLNQTNWGGPEVVFNVRNRLVHPPKRIEDPAWPEDELLETWKLVTEYLLLALLRLLKYQGEYYSRLELGRGAWQRPRRVPWGDC